MPKRRREKPSDSRANVECVTERVVNILGAELASAWLRNPNPLLDDRCPVDLIAAGRYREVLDLLDAMADGVFV
jgi:uncharacterized protein (DUF2384 family)